MKGSKILLVAVVAAMALVATGCGSKKGNTKTLDCKTQSSGVDVQLLLNYNDSKLDTFKVNYVMDLSQYSDEQISALETQDFCSVVSSAFGEYGMAFTGCKQNISDKKLNVNTDIDYNKLGEATVSELGKIDTAKSGFESAGYTCTIK